MVRASVFAGVEVKMTSQMRKGVGRTFKFYLLELAREELYGDNFVPR